MDRAAPPNQAEIEAVVRAYLARIARRYLPLLAGAVTLLLIVIFVPTASPNGQQQLGVGTPSTGSDGSVVPGTTSSAAAGAPAVAGRHSGVSAAPPSGTTAGGAAGGGTGSAGVSVPAGPVAPSCAAVRVRGR
jgi:hypothetical protein